MAATAPADAHAHPGLARKLENLLTAVSFRQYLALVFFVALALRVAAIFFLSNFGKVMGMENETIALNLLAGKGYVYPYIVHEMPTGIVAPVYTFFLYAHFWLFGKNYLFVELSQALVGSLSAVILAVLGKRVAGEKIGIVSGALLAAYPTYIYWCALPLPVTVDVFLVELSALLALVSVEKNKIPYSALAGAVMGVAALTKSFYLSFASIYWVWLWIWKKPKIQSLVYAGFIWAVFASMMIMPWSIRNYHVFHEWVPLVTNGGPNLWYGNNPNATGSLYTKDGKAMLSVIPDNLMQKIAAAQTEAAKSRAFKEAGMAWIKANPGAFVRLIPLRLRAIWWFDPEMSSSFPLLRKAVYLGLLVLTIPGMVVSRRYWRPLSLFYLLPLWETIFYSAFVGQARFRYLIEFGFLLFSAFFLVWLWEKSRGKSLLPKA